MNKETLLKQVSSAHKIEHCITFCTDAYQFLSEQAPEQRPVIFAEFIKEADNAYGRCRTTPTDDLYAWIRYCSKKYDTLIEGLIASFSMKAYSENEYYLKLWNSLEVLLSDATLKEKGYCLFAVVKDTLTPYYEFPLGLILSRDEVNEMFDSLKDTRKQLFFALHIPASQITEHTSRIVHLLDQLKTTKEKSFLLAVLLKRYEDMWSTKRTQDEASVQEQKSTKSDTAAIDKNFYDPNNTESLGNVVRKSFSYVLNDDRYEFALVESEGNVFLSDQGKTLEKLDAIFDFTSDVTKNIVAILNQYGVKKRGNEFVIEVGRFDSSIDYDDDENENLKKANLLLFSCVSFMLNMKIFYS